MLEILNLDPEGYSSKAAGLLKSAGRLTQKPLSRAELLKKIAGVDVLVLRFSHKIDRECLEAAKKLKIIAVAATGVDHIDVEYAQKKGVRIISLKGEIGFLKTISSTAELTWGLLLSLLRNIPGATADAKAGNWNRNAFVGRELLGMRLGIVGLGRIGEMVAGYGLAFGMEVSAYDPYRADWMADVARKENMSKLLKDIDVLSVHVPLNKETTGFIGVKELSALPKGSYLLNTSRGAVIKEDALLKALKSGQLAGAALDVLDGEPNVASNPLVKYAAKNSNLIITPHIGGAAKEAWEKTEVFVAEKIVRYAKDHK